MNFWHMQLHPNDMDGYDKNDIFEFVQNGYIGCSGNPVHELNRIQPEDIVLVRHGSKPVALVKATGNSQERPEDVDMWFDQVVPVWILGDLRNDPPTTLGTKTIERFNDKRRPNYRYVLETYKRIMEEEKVSEISNILITLKPQIILQGPPGTGKTRMAKQIAESLTKGNRDNWQIVQFHPAYSYEDFVRGIQVDIDKESGQPKYTVVNRVLTEFAGKASKAANAALEANEEPEKFVLILDEINRANLPAVLGELIYALEYRGEGVTGIYEIDPEGGEKSREISLPKNLYIIGTMNTADRSVGHIDYAIRRRFAFEDVPSKAEVIPDIANALYEKIRALFFSIEAGKPSKTLSADFQPEDVMIGHSYFIVNKDGETLTEEEKTERLSMKLEHEIKPILREYVRDGILLEGARTVIEDELSE